MMGIETLEYILDEIPFRVVREFQFDKHYGKRKFRADFAILKYGVLIEYEGINSYKSGHSTITGYTKDCFKYNLANILGFRLLRYTMKSLDDPEQVSKEILKIIKNINSFNIYNKKCSRCNNNFYICPNLWIKTKLGTICLNCQWEIDNKIAKKK